MLDVYQGFNIILSKFFFVEKKQFILINLCSSSDKSGAFNTNSEKQIQRYNYNFMDIQVIKMSYSAIRENNLFSFSYFMYYLLLIYFAFFIFATEI